MKSDLVAPGTVGGIAVACRVAPTKERIGAQLVRTILSRLQHRVEPAWLSPPESRPTRWTWRLSMGAKTRSVGIAVAEIGGLGLPANKKPGLVIARSEATKQSATGRVLSGPRLLRCARNDSSPRFIKGGSAARPVRN